MTPFAIVNICMCFEDPKELMSCKDEQIDGILWNTTMAGLTLKEPCPPKYQKGSLGQIVIKSCIQLLFFFKLQKQF